MKLSEFIRTHLEPLVRDWEQHASSVLPAYRDFSREELRDSAVQMLQAVADDMDLEQSEAQQMAKSRGLRPSNSPYITTYAHLHAKTRLAQGLALEHVFSEFRALRATVLRHWAAESEADRHALQDVVRFSEAIDEASLESLVWYGARVNSARDLFLGVLTHDLRTPLNAILMSAQVLLRDESLSVESTKAAVHLLNSGERMRSMIEDLLDFTRTRLGNRLPLHPVPCQLAPVVRLTAEEAMASRPAARVLHDCETELSGEWDSGRLSQMLSNLIVNAVQHGEPGKPVTVLARAEGEHAVITVHNEGRVIPPEIIASIFDPLMRGATGDGEASDPQQGLGLGLYISKQIAEAHGGRIEVASSPENGTTFTASLPRKWPFGQRSASSRTETSGVTGASDAKLRLGMEPDGGSAA